MTKKQRNNERMEVIDEVQKLSGTSKAVWRGMGWSGGKLVEDVKKRQKQQLFNERVSNNMS